MSRQKRQSLWKKKRTEIESYYQYFDSGGIVPQSETASTLLLADHLLIPAGHTYIYKLKITFENLEAIDQTADGLFSMQDDKGISYYYRGAVEKNYVKFGRDASGQDMWWRIIRFNGDGTMRMQYDGVGTSGTNTYTRGFALTSQPWNVKYNDAKYVGWMYGGTEGSVSTSREEAQRNETDSPIKTKVDEWYKKNIVDTGYSNYVADSIFCNNRSIPGKNITLWPNDTELGYGPNATGQGALGRFVTGDNDISTIANENPQPQFTCPQENDKFTVEEKSGGNGALTYPVGLITADEIVTAGSGKFSTASSYYLKKEDWYWSFSPFNLRSSGSANMFNVLGNGYLKYFYVGVLGGVAPVINLKTEYLDKLKGNGTIDNPYYLQVQIEKNKNIIYNHK